MKTIIKCTCNMKKHPWRDHAIRCPVYVAGLAAEQAVAAKAEAKAAKAEGKRKPRTITTSRHFHDITFIFEPNESNPHGFSGVMSVTEAKDLIKKLTITVIGPARGRG